MGKLLIGNFKGLQGDTPYIGKNGNWHIGGVDTGEPSRGIQGQAGIAPGIGENGNWWVGETDTGKPARGEQGPEGTAPHIGENGNWHIGETDTGIRADYQEATTSDAGLMSAAMATKLDGIEAGANKTTVVNSLTSTSTTSALSAAQGKALDGRIGAKVVITADSTSPPTDTSVLWVHGGDA